MYGKEGAGLLSLPHTLPLAAFLAVFLLLVSWHYTSLISAALSEPNSEVICEGGAHDMSGRVSWGNRLGRLGEGICFTSTSPSPPLKTLPKYKNKTNPNPRIQIPLASEICIFTSTKIVKTLPGLLCRFLAFQKERQ